jgi:hypothetical protein
MLILVHLDHLLVLVLVRSYLDLVLGLLILLLLVLRH